MANKDSLLTKIISSVFDDVKIFKAAYFTDSIY